MRPIQVVVGPLGATSATNIAASQTLAAAGWLTLNGGLGTSNATSVAASQSLASATTVTLNGSTKAVNASGLTIAYVGATSTGILPTRIFITSAGNDSSTTFTIIGTDINGGAITEVLTGSNAGTAASANAYVTIISITSSAATASTITVGTVGYATIPVPSIITITTASTIAFTIYGTDWAGSAISETVTNSGSSVSSIMSYATVTGIYAAAAATSVTVGRTQTGYSPWIKLDDWSVGQLAIQCTVTGTVSYSVQVSNDDPNSPTYAIAPSKMTWDSTVVPSGLVTATGTKTGLLASTFSWIRCYNASGSGTVTMTVTQAGAVDY